MSSHNRPNYQNTSLSHSFIRHSHAHGNESLQGDFVCMLASPAHVPGHLYCRKNSLAFYASAMRDETKILLNFDDITRIKKPTHHGYMDNAIEIIGKDNKDYTFVQFPNRDAAYALLTKLFREFIRTKKEQRDSKNNSPSQSLGDISKNLTNRSHDKSDSKSQASSSDSALSYSPNMSQYLTKEQQERNEDGYFQTVKTVLPVSVDQAFDFYFGDHPVFPYGEHLAHLGAYNVKVGKWKMNEQRHRQERRIHCNKALHGIFYDTEMGSKSIQSYREGDDGSILVVMKTKLLNVPYAESYYLKERFTLQPVENSRYECLITGYVNAIFTGDCCMKDMLEERVHEDKKKEHELWIQYIHQNKLYSRNTKELNIVKPQESETESQKNNGVEDPKSLIIDPKDIAHGDILIQSLKLPATPSPSIDPDFTDKDIPEGKTCADILNNKTTKSQIKPINLAESLEAVNESHAITKAPETKKPIDEDVTQKEQDIKLKEEISAQEDRSQDVLKSPKGNENSESINLTDKEKPINPSLTEEDQHAFNGSSDNVSKTNTGIFDSPIHSKGLQQKVQESNPAKPMAKKLEHEMEKVKDIKAKAEEKIEQTKPSLLQNKQDFSVSVSKERKMIRILFASLIGLFFLFMGTTLHLGFKLNNLQNICHASSA